MIKRILITAISIFIGAGAFADPKEPVTPVTSSSASVDAVAPDNSSAQPAGNLQDPSALDMPQTASASPEYDPDELICRREKQTGSKFTKRVCRTRAQIEARKEKDQASLREMGKIRTGGCKVSGEC